MKYTTYINKKSFTKSILTSSILAITGAMSAIPHAQAADVFFNTQLVSHFNPIPGYKLYADVWGENNLAVLGTNSGEGVFIIDITDPTFPVLASHYNPTNTKFKDVKISNGFGHFANDEDHLGVDLVDLSNPYSPVLTSKINDTNNGFVHVHNTFTDGNFLYEVDGRSSNNTSVNRNIVKVFNITNQATPIFVRDIPVNLTIGDMPHDITVVNNRLYVSNYGYVGNGVYDGRTDIIDVTNVADPVNFATLPLVASFDSGPGTHNSWVTDDNNTLVVGREIPDGTSYTPIGDMSIYDISQVDGATALTPVSIVSADSLGIDAATPHNVVISGDRALIAWYQAGLQVLDISNPAAPQHVGSYDTFPGSCDGTRKTCANYAGAWGVYPFRTDGNVLVSDMNSGLYIIDASHAAIACNGDFDSDGDVDLSDQNIINAELGRTDCSKRNVCQADFDGDRDVDSADVAVFDADYLRTDCPIEITNEQPVVTVTSPLPSSAALQEVGLNANINFVASASDAEDGDVTNSIVWESSLDGVIGNGGNVSAVLSTGMHTVRASVTDSDSAHGADFAVIIVSDQPAPVEIILNASGYTKKGKTKSHVVDLSWSGTTAEFVEIYRNGNLIASIANNGLYTDDTGLTGSASYDYTVCESGTSTCSFPAQVVF